MKITVLCGIAGLSVTCALGPVAFAQSSQSYSSTVERTTTTEVPKTVEPPKVVEERSSTTVKRGLFGRKKATTTTTTRTERNPDPAPSTSTEVHSKTTVETQRDY